MKTLLSMGLILCLAISMTGCCFVPIAQHPTETIPVYPAETIPTYPTEPSISIPTTEETLLPTEPEHSALYIPNVSTEEIITYFEEVALSMEYTTGSGDVSLVQKWVQPIRYRIDGNPTPEDIAILNGLLDALNRIDGFPGIYAAQELPPEDLTIRFLDLDSFNLAFSETVHGEIADGAVQFWYYTDTNEIYNGRIGCRTDISQQVRNSVILEEVINCLGFNDTTLREDSILYQYSSDNTQLSNIDWVLIQLLYHPDMRCGMNAYQCREVIRKLYY